MIEVYRGIKKLYTFQGLAKKDGRCPQDSDLGMVEQGLLAVQKGVIVFAGSEKDFKKNQKKILGKNRFKTIDLNAQTVFPAFLECHTHLIFAGDRQNEFEMRNRGATYQEITRRGGGIASTVNATRAASGAQLVKLAQDRVDTLVQQGVACIEIKSGYGLSEKEEFKILKAAKKLKGPEIVPTYLGPHSRSPEFSSLEEYFSHLVQVTLPRLKKMRLADRVDIFVEEGFFSLDQGRRYIRAAQELGFQITGHVEQLSSTGAAREFSAGGAVSVDHLVHLSAEDQKTIARSNTTCVLLPTSDFYLKIPYPPARGLLNDGARVALSTDFNPGTSPTLDLSFLGVLARLEMKMTRAEVFSSLTYGAAAALSRANRYGSLEVGKGAHFVVSDAGLEDFFYQVGVHPVRATAISGRFFKKT